MRRAGGATGRRPPAIVGEGRGESGGRIEGLGDLEELTGLQPTASIGALDRWSDVARRPDAHRRSFGEEGTGLIRLVQATLDQDRIVRRLERQGEPMAGLEAGRCGES